MHLRKFSKNGVKTGFVEQKTKVSNHIPKGVTRVVERLNKEYLSDSSANRGLVNLKQKELRMLNSASSLDKVQQIELFKYQVGEKEKVGVHFVGEKDGAIKHSCLRFDGDIIYRYGDMPYTPEGYFSTAGEKNGKVLHISDRDVQVFDRPSKKVLIDEACWGSKRRNGQIQLVPRMDNGAIKAMLKKKEVTSQEFREHVEAQGMARFMEQHVEPLRDAVNRLQQKKVKGSSLIAVSDLISPETTDRGKLYAIPIVSHTAKQFFDDPQLSEKDRMELAKQCVRDNYVAAQALRTVGYIAVDQKLDNCVVVRDKSKKSNDVAGLRFAQIDIDDIPLINDTKPRDRGCGHNSPQLRAYEPIRHLMTREEWLKLMQLRNFYLLLLEASLSEDDFTRVRSLRMPNWGTRPDFNFVTDAVEKVNEVLDKFGLESKSAKDLVITLIANPLSLLDPTKLLGLSDMRPKIKKLESLNMDKTTPERVYMVNELSNIVEKELLTASDYQDEDVDKQYFVKNTAFLKETLEKLIDVKKYKEPVIDTNRQELYSGRMNHMRRRIADSLKRNSTTITVKNPTQEDLQFHGALFTIDGIDGKQKMQFERTLSLDVTANANSASKDKQQVGVDSEDLDGAASESICGGSSQQEVMSPKSMYDVPAPPRQVSPDTSRGALQVAVEDVSESNVGPAYIRASTLTEQLNDGVLLTRPAVSTEGKQGAADLENLEDTPVEGTKKEAKTAKKKKRSGKESKSKKVKEKIVVNMASIETPVQEEQTKRVVVKIASVEVSGTNVSNVPPFVHIASASVTDNEDRDAETSSSNMRVVSARQGEDLSESRISAGVVENQLSTQQEDQIISNADTQRGMDDENGSVHSVAEGYAVSSKEQSADLVQSAAPVHVRTARTREGVFEEANGMGLPRGNAKNANGITIGNRTAEQIVAPVHVQSPEHDGEPSMITSNCAAMFARNLEFWKRKIANQGN